jgi:hypothetical protein
MIDVSKVIYYLLANNTTITNYIGTRIFPLVLPENSNFPLVVYERRTNPEYTKDGAALKFTIAVITVISNDYSQSIDIATAINNVFDDYSGTVNGINVQAIRLDSVDEIYANGAYMQKLVYNILTV